MHTIAKADSATTVTYGFSCSVIYYKVIKSVRITCSFPQICLECYTNSQILVEMPRLTVSKVEVDNLLRVVYDVLVRLKPLSENT